MKDHEWLQFIIFQQAAWYIKKQMVRTLLSIAQINHNLKNIGLNPLWHYLIISINNFVEFSPRVFFIPGIIIFLARSYCQEVSHHGVFVPLSFTYFVKSSYNWYGSDLRCFWSSLNHFLLELCTYIEYLGQSL